MRVTILFALLFLMTSCKFDESYGDSIIPTSNYLSEIKKEFLKEWPNNRTINLVFHGHSVPAGYFKTPTVNTFDSYPFQVLKQLKEKYPFAVINVINTSIGGETSLSGQKRFEAEVLNHKPDILFIDYALNDRSIGLEDARKALEKMIESAKKEGIKIILLTPSPDLAVNLSHKDNELEKHSNQIKELAKKYNIGLADSYSIFKQLKADCDCIDDYMSQSNHPNAKGHSIIADEIIKYFIE
jgi:acyl-CoA thioesterase-1